MNSFLIDLTLKELLDNVRYSKLKLSSNSLFNKVK